MKKVAPVSPGTHEAPATDLAIEREPAPPGIGEKHEAPDTAEDLMREVAYFARRAIADGRATRLGDRREPEPRDSRGLEPWRVELAEIASLAANIDTSLRRARDSMTGLFESVDELASRAFDAERSLRDAEDRIRALGNT